MKTILTIIVIIALTGLIVSCTTQPPSTTEVVVLQDITDASLTRPNLEEILSQYNLTDKWNGAVLRFTDISDVSLNKTTEVKLDSRNEWLSNELDRDKEIEKFKNQVKEIVTEAGKEQVGKDRSSIYLPIFQELNRLSQTKMQRKIMVVYSDLMENTTDLSYYRPKDLLQLKNSPELIQKKFETLLPLNSLSGIEVYFIFQPKDEKSDQNYQIISKFYQRLLEAKGAKVNISANINP